MKTIPIFNVPDDLLHSSGPNQGNLRQDLLQLQGVSLKCGDLHPLCAEIVYLQTNKKKGVQQWTTKHRDEHRVARNRFQARRYYYANKPRRNHAN